MITCVKGEIQYIGRNFLEIACGNIGYKVFCVPMVLGAYSVGKNAEFFTHLHVREDAQTLYGFNTRIEDFAGENGSDLREGGDVIDALVGLGYSRYQAQTALRSLPENVEGVENKVKEALKILGK